MKKFFLVFGVLISSTTSVIAYDNGSVSNKEIVGRASVVDGDTLDIQGKRVRLLGVDAPESGQWCLNESNYGYPCGKDVSFWLSSWLENKNVSCIPNGKVTYDRIVAECFVGGMSVNNTLVLNGMATAEAKYSRKFLISEGKAIYYKKGMWSGKFDRPSKYRRGDNEISDYAKKNVDPRLKKK